MFTEHILYIGNDGKDTLKNSRFMSDQASNENCREVIGEDRQAPIAIPKRHRDFRASGHCLISARADSSAAEAGSPTAIHDEFALPPLPPAIHRATSSQHDDPRILPTQHALPSRTPVTALDPGPAAIHRPPGIPIRRRPRRRAGHRAAGKRVVGSRVGAVGEG